MQTQPFDQETEQYLSDLLAREQTTTSELLKTLIRDRWLRMQEQAFAASESVLPENTASTELLKQKTQKQRISEYVRKKCVR